MPVFVRRLFGIGKLPADLRAEVEAEGVIYLADYVAVTRRFSGAIPGLRSAHSVASYVGSLVFTSQRVLATLSSLPKLAGPTVDVHWDATQSGTATAQISLPVCRLMSMSTRWTRRSPGISRCTTRSRFPAMCSPGCPPIPELRHAAGIRFPRGRRHLPAVTGQRRSQADEVADKSGHGGRRNRPNCRAPPISGR